MVSKRKGTRLLEAGEVIGNVVLNNDGSIVIPPGLVDFEIGPADSSYSLKLRGIAFSHGLNMAIDPSQATVIAVTRTIHKRDYRLVGLVTPFGANTDISKAAELGMYDRDSTLLPLPSTMTAGQLEAAGVPGGLPIAFEAGPGLIDLTALNAAVGGATPVPRITFISDDKGPNLTVDDRIRVRMAFGIPTEHPMVLHIAVSTEAPIQ